MIERLQAKRNEEGFTLIELLIVIIVLGILAAIVVFAIGSTRKDSVASACKSNWKSIELSAEAVNTKTGGYPAVADLNQSGNIGGLLKAFPATGSDYTLAYTTGGTATTYTDSAGTNHSVYPSYAIAVQKPAGTAVAGSTGAVSDCNLLP